MILNLLRLAPLNSEDIKSTFNSATAAFWVMLPDSELHEIILMQKISFHNKIVLMFLTKLKNIHNISNVKWTNSWEIKTKYYFYINVYIVWFIIMRQQS